jgi:hypothetical protein
MSGLIQRLGCCALILMLSACGGSGGPVRSPMQAAEVAQRALRAAGLDEEVIDSRRQGDAWLVITRWRESSVGGHLVTVDAATGQARVERYRSVELGAPR